MALHHLPRLAASAGRLFYPPICAGCQCAVGSRSAFCGSCWGQLSFIEPPYCEILGTPFPYDPGAGAISPEAMADPPAFGRMRSVVLHRDLGARLVSLLKFSDRTDLAPIMARWMARSGHELLADADVVVPVPLHRSRLLRRHFNQAAELARHVARLSAKPYSPLALVRSKATQSQIGLRRRQRHENVRGVFAVVPGRLDEVRHKRVLLVDDVFTTGSTVASATTTLLKAGALQVDVLTFSRVADGAP